jgi:hypothetical protein
MRKLRSLLALSALLSSLLLPQVFAAPKGAVPKPAPSSAAPDNQLLPEALGAKTFLEEMLVRRYSQELSTLVDRQQFFMGAHLELTLLPPPKEDDPNAIGDYPPDLLLGTLDPEEVLKKFAGSDSRALAEGFLKGYRIRTAKISVGLNANLAPETKGIVEKWLKERLASEFGAVGTSSVSTISAIPEKPVVKKPWQERIADFQALIGFAILSLALIFGVLAWKLLVSREAKFRAQQEKALSEAGAAANAAAAGASSFPPGPPAPPKEDEAGGPSLDGAVPEDEKEEDKGKNDNPLEVVAEIRSLTQRLSDLMPKLPKESDKTIRSWCMSGDEGKLKLACFAEIASGNLGKIPIPADAIGSLSKVFAQMPNLKITEKRDLLRKVYWDLLATINLGADSITQPFSYISEIDNSLLSEIMLDSNPKMKALVALYIPDDSRTQYIQSLNAETKRELYYAAFDMKDVSTKDVTTLDSSLKDKLASSGSNARDSLPVEPMLKKLIEALGPEEEISILGGMTGPSLAQVKKSYGSLAFLSSWPDDKLMLLFGAALPQEVVAFLRLRPELKDRIIPLCPQMTAELVTDELVQPDTQTPEQRKEALKLLDGKLKELVKSNQVSLEQVFGSETQSTDAGTGNTGTDEKAA